ncbi:hypothetical protein ACG94X_14140 [Acinetobacter sp. ULE_I010]|uniref:hypothetical protein n=1 Tax=Acinetobacter sp. ULE_I010 TaxID=3373065 RepID=UPI003AF55F62
MNICIGGDLNGQIIEKEVFQFKVDTESDKSPIYFRQSVVLDLQLYRFWFSSTVTFQDAVVVAEQLVRKKVKG